MSDAAPAPDGGTSRRDTGVNPADARIAVGDVVGFIGLGNMGHPMATRLAGGGYAVRAYDQDPAACAALADVPGVTIVDGATAAADGAAAVILMLPNSDIVESVVHDAGLLAALAPGAYLIDMGSSEPTRTRALAPTVAEKGATLIDAPVSGGVRGAVAGTLTVMVGGEPGAAEAVRPVLETMGGNVMHVGPSGAGHALKALNNLMSATNLLVASEAVVVGREFGLDPKVMLDAVNVSTGSSGATEVKWPRFMLDRSFDAGFTMGLMVKDMRIATSLARSTGWPSRLGEVATEMWAKAADRLSNDADHTEIVRWLEEVHENPA